MTEGPVDDGIRSAYLEAESECRSLEDAAAAYERAGELRTGIDRLVGKAADLRAEMAYRVQTTEGISVDQLARKLGISKARAGQLSKAAKDNLAASQGGSGPVSHGSNPAADSAGQP
ncbi:MAG: hypothetical protein ACRC0L_04015 [Angustibacter sp.]